MIERVEIAGECVRVITNDRGRELFSGSADSRRIFRQALDEGEFLGIQRKTAIADRRQTGFA